MDKNTECADSHVLAQSIANRTLARTRKHMQADLEHFLDTLTGKLPPRAAIATVTHYMVSLTVHQAYKTLSMPIGGQAEDVIKQKIVVKVLAAMCHAAGFTSNDMAELCNDASIEMAAAAADQATTQ